MRPFTRKLHNFHLHGKIQAPIKKSAATFHLLPKCQGFSILCFLPPNYRFQQTTEYNLVFKERVILYRFTKIISPRTGKTFLSIDSLSHMPRPLNIFILSFLQYCLIPAPTQHSMFNFHSQIRKPSFSFLYQHLPF